MPPGYSRESWCDHRVPEKLMFGHTFTVGLDMFLRYLSSHALAAGRLVRGCLLATAGHVSGPSSLVAGYGRSPLARAGVC